MLFSALGRSTKTWLLTNPHSLDSDCHNTEENLKQQGTEQGSPGELVFVTVFLKVLEKQIWNLPLILSPSAPPSPGNDVNISSPLLWLN
jgi:hypothetical protein